MIDVATATRLWSEAADVAELERARARALRDAAAAAQRMVDAAEDEERRALATVIVAMGVKP